MKIGIYGYGNLARGVEAAVAKSEDTELVAVFSRRDPKSVKTVSGTPVYSAESVTGFAGKIDVLVICGGSAFDLPKMTPELAKKFCVVDSFDTHAKIPEHFAAVNASALEGGNTALICCGWDPGMFSVMRLYSRAILPDGGDCTFWGKGVSQGHSDAARRIEGVLDARQYTIPVQKAMDAVRSGNIPEFTARDKHTRCVYVVAKEGADKARIEKEIKSMPNYYAEYDTEVHFITGEEMEKNHSALPHGGCVIRTGATSPENKSTMEFSLKLDSNPEFTGSVLLACARAVYKKHKNGQLGCYTMLDIAPAELSFTPRERLISELL